MTIIDKIFQLKNELGLTNKEIEAGAGLANSSMSQWSKGKGKPSLENIIKLSLFFHVSSDYLLCLSENRNGSSSDMESSDTESAHSGASETPSQPDILTSSDNVSGLRAPANNTLSEEESVLVNTFRTTSVINRFRIIQLCMNIRDETRLAEQDRDFSASSEDSSLYQAFLVSAGTRPKK